MSKFTPTKEEKAALSYLDWDDAALGRFTKHVACTLEKLRKDDEGLRKVSAAACGMILIGMAFDSNAETLNLTLEGHARKEIPTGDWKITVRRTKEAGRRR